MFNIGDRVRIRSWNDMENEFGLEDRWGSEPLRINCDCSFTEEMRSWCGEELTISNKEFMKHYNKNRYKFEESTVGGYTITDDMLELAEPVREITYEEFEKIIS